MARPKKELDPKLIEELASAQLTNVEIARICGCEEKTITRRFGERLKRWKEQGVGSVRRELYATAMGNSKGKVTAMIFFLKNYGGMADVKRLEDNRGVTDEGMPVPYEFRDNQPSQTHKPN